ncbi:hypothetical protein GGR50DRAFT_675749 [Xylaria sp. CBS 124048]|nr:hypothetical protein GGR50DRAFT_675749 [Xylaria sp. CBS 124048]
MCDGWVRKTSLQNQLAACRASSSVTAVPTAIAGLPFQCPSPRASGSNPSPRLIQRLFFSDLRHFQRALFPSREKSTRLFAMLLILQVVIALTRHLPTCMITTEWLSCLPIFMVFHLVTDRNLP